MAPRRDKGFPRNPTSKRGYTLEFNDDFSGHKLDAARWLPFYLPQWSSRQLAAARYSLPGDCLQLHIEAGQEPWCPDYDGRIRVSSLQTGCFAGPVGTPEGQHRFNAQLVVKEEQPVLTNYLPKYGYFEARLRAVPVPGYMVALWMIGFESSAEESAELCICEIFGAEVTAKQVTVGYGLHPFGDALIRDEFYKDIFEIDAAQYHVYAADWRPEQVEFSIDNRSIRIIHQSPRYPMQFMLGIYEIPNQLSAESRPDVWPKTFEVDYVRGYRLKGGAS
jgi:hypothetical protein